MVENLEIFGQLLLAALLGSLVGLERKLARKGAGIRTFALVTLGACLFTTISVFGFGKFAGGAAFDPSRIASQVVVGIGFIGAGVIIFQKPTVRGLTTAASLWVSAAIGMAVSLKMYGIAVFTAILTVFVLYLLWFLENLIVKYVVRRKFEEDEDEGD